MLGGMVGGRTGAMIGGMAGAMIGGRRLSGMLGGLKNQLSNDDDKNSLQPEGSLTEADAALLIRVMANAAKADGEVSQSEVDAIMGELGEASEQERAYLQRELASPFTDVRTIAGSVPRQLGPEAYVVSLVAIQVDTDQESTYLAALADGLGLERDVIDAIHDDLQVQRAN